MRNAKWIKIDFILNVNELIKKKVRYISNGPYYFMEIV